jgi:hypothetical protein
VALAVTTSALGSFGTVVVPPLSATREVASPEGSDIVWLLVAASACSNDPAP